MFVRFPGNLQGLKKKLLQLKKKGEEEESADLLKRTVCWLLFAVFQFKHLRDEMKMKTFFFAPRPVFSFKLLSELTALFSLYERHLSAMPVRRLFSCRRPLTGG